MFYQGLRIEYSIRVKLTALLEYVYCVDYPSIKNVFQNASLVPITRTYFKADYVSASGASQVWPRSSIRELNIYFSKCKIYD